MSFVISAPQELIATASDLARIGSTLESANAVAAGSTTALLMAGADEVSQAIAAIFSQHGAAYQAVSVQVGQLHSQFVQTLNCSADAYLRTEAANVEQALVNTINAPSNYLVGRMLIGDGAAGAPGQAGQDGGIL